MKDDTLPAADAPVLAPVTVLDGYAVMPAAPEIVPAAHSRDWMDEFPDRHIYRCLPVAIGNSFGWDILCPTDVALRWNGGPDAKDITIEVADKEGFPAFAKSHFSSGVVTFEVGVIFRTSPGWALVATGPTNTLKDAIVPLTGIIETEWLPYTFTMNWRFTRPGRVAFAKGEPFCRVFPVPKNAVRDVRPTLRPLSANPDLEREHLEFRSRRDDFMRRLREGDPEALKSPWGKDYFKGLNPATGMVAEDHQQKLRPRPFDRSVPVLDYGSGPAPAATPAAPGLRLASTSLATPKPATAQAGGAPNPPTAQAAIAGAVDAILAEALGRVGQMSQVPADVRHAEAVCAAFIDHCIGVLNGIMQRQGGVPGLQPRFLSNAAAVVAGQFGGFAAAVANVPQSEVELYRRDLADRVQSIYLGSHASHSASLPKS